MDDKRNMSSVTSLAPHTNAALDTKHKKAFSVAIRCVRALRSESVMPASGMPVCAAHLSRPANLSCNCGTQFAICKRAQPTINPGCCYAKIDRRIAVVVLVMCGMPWQQRGPLVTNAVSCYIYCCAEGKSVATHQPCCRTQNNTLPCRLRVAICVVLSVPAAAKPV